MTPELLSASDTDNTTDAAPLTGRLRDADLLFVPQAALNQPLDSSSTEPNHLLCSDTLKLIACRSTSAEIVFFF